MPPKDCGRPCKQALIITSEAASSGLAFGTKVIMKDSQQAMDEKHYDMNLSSKRCQLDLRLDHPFTRFHNDVDLKIDSVDNCVKRVNMDLNIPIGSWDDVCDKVMQTGSNGILCKAGFQEMNLEVSPLHTPLGTQLTNRCTNKAMSSNFGFNSSTSNDQSDSDIGLDLQLKLPCRPGLRMDWAVNSPPHLTLSLIGNGFEQDPEMTSSQPDGLNVIEEANLDLSDGVLLDETARVVCSTGHEAASGNVKLKESETCLQNMVCDNDSSTPIIKVDSQSTSRSLGSNSLIVNAESRPSGCGLLLQSDPERNACENIDTLASRKLDEREEVLNRGCIFKHVLGNVDRTPVVESSLSNEKESLSNAKVTGLMSRLFHYSGVSDVKKHVNLDGISQGSAEMECSDGEYYTSKAVTESDITVDSYQNNLERVNKHIVLDVGITRKASGKDFRESKVGSDKAKTDLNGLPEDVRVEVPAKTDGKEKQILDSEQMTDQNVENLGIKKNGKSVLLATNFPRDPYEVLTSSSQRVDKPSQEAKRNSFLNEKLQMNPKRTITSANTADMRKASVAKAAANIGKNHEDNRNMDASEDNALSKKQKALELRSDKNDGPNKFVKDGEDSQSKKVSSTLVRSSGAPLPANWERLMDQSRRERPNSRGRRDESPTFEGDKWQDENVNKHGYDFRNIRKNRRDNYQSAYIHSDGAYGTQYASEVGKSIYQRIPRSTNEESPHPSPFTSRRRSPAHRDLLHPSVNEFTGTYMRRESDPHEAQMRGLRNRIGDRSAYRRSSVHYERSKQVMTHRERINRVHPVSFHDHSDMLRSDRQPPRQPCFPRPASPLYSSDDMREMCATEEFDAPSREVLRNARRLDFIDQQDSMEEYGGSLHFVEPPELMGNEVADRRIFHESDNFPGPFDQHLDDEETSLYYRELDQRRAIMFRHNADVYGDDRENTRDFEGRSRNFSSKNRLRYSGQAPGYKYQNIPGFRDGGLDDARMKRRRL